MGRNTPSPKQLGHVCSPVVAHKGHAAHRLTCGALIGLQARTQPPAGKDERLLVTQARGAANAQQVLVVGGAGSERDRHTSADAALVPFVGAAHGARHLPLPLIASSSGGASAHVCLNICALSAGETVITSIACYLVVLLRRRQAEGALAVRCKASRSSSESLPLLGIGTGAHPAVLHHRPHAAHRHGAHCERGAAQHGKRAGERAHALEERHALVLPLGHAWLSQWQQLAGRH